MAFLAAAEKTSVFHLLIAAYRHSTFLCGSPVFSPVFPVFWPTEIVPEMTCNVLSATLNLYSLIARLLHGMRTRISHHLGLSILCIPNSNTKRSMVPNAQYGAFIFPHR